MDAETRGELGQTVLMRITRWHQLPKWKRVVAWSALATAAVAAMLAWLPTELARVLGNVFLATMAFELVLFSVVYIVRSKPFRTAIGTIFARKSIVFSLVMIHITVSVLIERMYPGRDVWRMVIYLAGAVVYVPMITSLVRTQNQQRRDPVNEQEQ